MPGCIWRQRSFARRVKQFGGIEKAESRELRGESQNGSMLSLPVMVKDRSTGGGSSFGVMGHWPA
jgi:hypothetical protein